MIGSDGTSQAPTWRLWLAAAKVGDAQLAANRPGDLTFREEIHAIDAALAGQGIAICSDVVVGHELKTGALVKAHELSLPGYGFYLRGNEAPETSRTMDLGQSERFLDALVGGDSTNECFTFQTLDDDLMRKDRRFNVVRYGTLRNASGELERLNSDGAAVYVTINKTKAGRRTTENVTDVRAVFIDLDGGPIDPVKAWSIQPHIVVESSPGKYHAYWRVNGVKLEEFGMLQRKLATLFNGDRSVCDLPRILRLQAFGTRRRVAPANPPNHL